MKRKRLSRISRQAEIQGYSITRLDYGGNQQEYLLRRYGRHVGIHRSLDLLEDFLRIFHQSQSSADVERDTAYDDVRQPCLSAKSHGNTGIARPSRSLVLALRERGYTDPRWIRSGYEGMLEWRTLSVIDSHGHECRAWVYPHSAAAGVAAGEVEFTRGPWDSLGRLRNP